MGFIQTETENALTISYLHPIRYGLIIYGVIAAIVFVFRMARKEDITYDPIPKPVVSIVMALIWPLGVYYLFLWKKIGGLASFFACSFVMMAILNTTQGNHPVTKYLNTLGLGLGTISDVYACLALLAMATVIVLIGYFVEKSAQKRFEFERQRRSKIIKAADVSSPDKWNN